MSERAPSPAGDDLLVEQHDGVLTLTINRADASNAIPYTVRDALIAEFERAHADLAVRVVVLTGAGERHFCTGADLRVRPPAPVRPDGAPEFVTGQAVEMMRTGFQRLMVAIQDCQKPVIAALNGTAAGGGAMLALAADLVVAADTARFVDVFASRGLVPDGGFAYLLPHIVGMHRAAEIVMLGDTISATEARDLGIVNRVVPAGELAATTAELAARLAARPTKVLGWAKHLLHSAVENPRHTVLEQEGLYVELNLGTADNAERTAAMGERRDPEFRGW
ncbi:MAG: enoyl-CoA hydratase/isomerase family protein [Actinomycetes bacterium]